MSCSFCGDLRMIWGAFAPYEMPCHTSKPFGRGGNSEHYGIAGGQKNEAITEKSCKNTSVNRFESSKLCTWTPSTYPWLEF